MSICAIIVSYHPTDEIYENVDALVNQVDEIIIVDNGSGSDTKDLLDNLEKKHSKVSVIFLQENLGIAAALNVGVKKAKVAGYEWVITFDQDSQVTPFMIDTMLQVNDTYPQKETVASLSPRYKNKETGEIYGNTFTKNYCESLPYAETLEAITSGNLVKSSVFESVGYFNETLFIDSVDIEFSLRCVTKGYKLLEVKDAFLLHSVGFPTRHKFLWKNPITSNHNPLRRYYTTRNAIYTYKKFLLYQPIWTTKSSYRFIKNLVIVILFEKERKKKLVAVLIGFLDCFLGRMGKCTREKIL